MGSPARFSATFTSRSRPTSVCWPPPNLVPSCGCCLGRLHLQRTFVVLDKEELRGRLAESVAQVVDLLYISDAEATRVLRFYKWDLTKLQVCRLVCECLMDAWVGGQVA